MRLYGYWRSTSSYRLRIALALKGLRPDQVPVHLVHGGGEHRSEAYRRINPQARVPSLALDDGSVLIQSPAIIEYLEEVPRAGQTAPDRYARSSRWSAGWRGREPRRAQTRTRPFFRPRRISSWNPISTGLSEPTPARGAFRVAATLV
ncbi:hypothetical protein OPKNFCMD_6713 [Methylobacterium crusticola]|uniref:GST N-terminal domain-containing protein n=1 Tax=Methylobacterium crusticola TaxID=1697972 RepID=A0ABQ4RA02_9HYPH|nr:glutathione S-transferase N-terminal domain-containing protein [Methylobacterium crusticola]GJD53934.1 hypothetical protein OPKNFCMD_6713 [Methylobacterium crusticola]